MKLIDFLNRFKKTPAFSIREIEQLYPGFERDNLLNWQKKGYILRIRNGWYSISGRITIEAELYWVANKIYRPSYVSLEKAFAYYHWIPEAVFTITSVSTLKTKVFDTPLGNFCYSSIKPSLFWGYQLIKVDEYGIKMAEPEKALLDFLYLNPNIQTLADFESLRFNIDQIREDVNQEKLTSYSNLFESASLSKRVKTFIKYLDYVESL